MSKKKASSNEKNARSEALAQIKAEQATRDRRRALVFWAGVTALVVAVGAVATFAITRQSEARDLSAVRSYEVESKHVTTDVKYAQTPPVGGEHDPTWLNCGVYQDPVREENAVHSLEHGAVWITYSSELPDSDVAALRGIVGDANYLILSPIKGLPSPIVASAWGKQLTFSELNETKLKAFIDTYREGPQTPEPGAACTGGIGEPSV